MQFKAQFRKIPTASSAEFIYATQEPGFYPFYSFLERKKCFLFLPREEKLPLHLQGEKEGMMLFKFSRDAQRTIIPLRLATTDI